MHCASSGSLVESTESLISSWCRTYTPFAIDAFSITVSAIAIVQSITDLIIGTRSYYKCVKYSTKKIVGLIHELESFDILLKSLKGTSQRADENHKQQIGSLARNVGPQHKASRPPMLQRMMEADAPLSPCYNQMLAFTTKLAKDQSGVKRSLKWPFEIYQIKAVIRRLRIFESLLDTAVANDHL